MSTHRKSWKNIGNHTGKISQMITWNDAGNHTGKIKQMVTWNKASNICKYIYLTMVNKEIIQEQILISIISENFSSIIT